MKIKPKSYFLIGIMAVMIVAIFLSSGFSFWEAKVLPLFIAGFVLFLAVWELSAELRAGDKGSGLVVDGPHEEGKVNMELRRFYSVMGWMSAFCIGSYLLGFLIAIPLFTFSYLKVQQRSLFASLSVAAILFGFIYLAFEVGLSAQLFPGVIFG